MKTYPAIEIDAILHLPSTWPGLLTTVASILAITLSLGRVFFAQCSTEAATIHRIYATRGAAVAEIEVKSAGITGSGVVFDQHGYLLTNYHVIRAVQNDQDIAVWLAGPGQVPARLVGYDVATDLAILQIDAPPDHLTVADFGDSSRVQVGDLAVAIGSPFRLSHSLTVGHISAVGRRLLSNDPYALDIESVLQTDAAINPGNSGGPLFNARGQVIGINAQIESPSGGSVGLGFAIPGNTAIQVAREIIARGYVRHPFLGISGRPINATLARDLDLPIDHGLLLQDIRPGSPAAQIGLRAGQGLIRTTYGGLGAGADVILSIDGQPVQTQSDLNRLVAQHAIGDRVELGILRDGRRLTLEATLTERPPDDAWGHFVRTATEADEREIAGALR
jgi:S1-C subfamily serine protease